MRDYRAGVYEDHRIDVMVYANLARKQAAAAQADRTLMAAAREQEIDALMAKAKHFEGKANACYLVGHMGRQRYYLRRKDHFTAKAVTLKMAGAL